METSWFSGLASFVCHISFQTPLRAIGSGAEALAIQGFEHHLQARCKVPQESIPEKLKRDSAGKSFSAHCIFPIILSMLLHVPIKEALTITTGMAIPSLFVEESQEQSQDIVNVESQELVALSSGAQDSQLLGYASPAVIQSQSADSESQGRE